MAERVLQIDLSSAVPAYRQVVDQLRTLLVEQRFAAGERLFTVRRLAIDLGVHHNTVAQAYRELADEGWLELTRGRGATVVSRAAPKDPGHDVQAGWCRRLTELVAQGLAAGLPADAVHDALLTTARAFKVK